MKTDVTTKQNIKQAVPLFMIHNMDLSLNFYVEGLGFELKNKWTPLGKIKWCRLQRDGAAVMLQEYNNEGPHAKIQESTLGEGVSIWFLCENALELHQEFLSKKLHPSEPFVGNGMWDVKIIDPDGYNLHFESVTDVPEKTTYSQWQNNLK